MRDYPIPLDEAARLIALEGTGALKLTGDVVLDNAAQVARRLLEAPIALVSLVGADMQYFVARCGLDSGGSHRSASICTHTIMQARALVILDATADPRTCDNPLVTGPPFIGFYAGAPIVLGNGMKLGAVCAIDNKPRGAVDPVALEALEALARMVGAHIEKFGDHTRAQQRLNDALGAARREVLGLTSQQMRGPVAALRAMVDTPGPVTHRDGIDVAAGQLATLADRVAAFAVAVPEGMGLEEAPVDLRGLARDCIAMAAPEARTRGATLAQDDGDAVIAFADPAHLRAAIGAALDSALGAAAARLTVGAATGDDAMMVTVLHDGAAVGATADTCERLTLARSLMALHGGELTVTQAAMGGTQIALRLPPWRRIAAPVMAAS